MHVHIMSIPYLAHRSKTVTVQSMFRNETILTRANKCPALGTKGIWPMQISIIKLGIRWQMRVTRMNYINKQCVISTVYNNNRITHSV